MPAKLNLQGQRFGQLVATESAGRAKGGILWTCSCDCGGTATVTAGRLRAGHHKSCGCRGPKLRELAGRVVGRLNVLKRAPDKRNKVYWLCQCSCGNLAEVLGTYLNQGYTRSCGCLAGELVGINRRTHGMSGSREYSAWLNMRSRCLNPQTPSYKYYGGRGVKIASEFSTFEGFYAAVGQRPPGMSLDRINVNGDYAPGNVRWATAITQAGNTRKSLLLTYQGKTQCVAAWARENGMKVPCIKNRLARGWDIERALSTPSGADVDNVGLVKRFAAIVAGGFDHFSGMPAGLPLHYKCGRSND